MSCIQKKYKRMDSREANLQHQTIIKNEGFGSGQLQEPQHISNNNIGSIPEQKIKMNMFQKREMLMKPVCQMPKRKKKTGISPQVKWTSDSSGQNSFVRGERPAKNKRVIAAAPRAERQYQSQSGHSELFLEIQREFSEMRNSIRRMIEDQSNEEKKLAEGEVMRHLQSDQNHSEETIENKSSSLEFMMSSRQQFVYRQPRH